MGTRRSYNEGAGWRQTKRQQAGTIITCVNISLSVPIKVSHDIRINPALESRDVRGSISSITHPGVVKGTRRHICGDTRSMETLRLWSSTT